MKYLNKYNHVKLFKTNIQTLIKTCAFYCTHFQETFMTLILIAVTVTQTRTNHKTKACLATDNFSTKVMTHNSRLRVSRGQRSK